MPHTVLFGLDRHGAVAHTEALEDREPQRLARIAEAKLPEFHAVEVWVESVRVIRLRRTVA